MQTAQIARIYVYSAPGYDKKWVRTVGSETIEGRGRLKIGMTIANNAPGRVRDQSQTIYPDGDGIVIHLDEAAVKDDGTSFRDKDVHAVLKAHGVNAIQHAKPGSSERDSEVFEVTLDEVRAALVAVRTGRPYDPRRTADFPMRPEQRQAVDQTAAYFSEHASDAQPPRVLWNAKMRFGKTFAAYQLAERMRWRRVLVLTYKPAVRDAWRDDLLCHVDFADWQFADREHPVDPDTDSPVVWFASFQDILGTAADGTVKSRNVDVHLIDWDCIILDEYHFGAWQGAAKELTTPDAARTSDKRERELEETDAERADELGDVTRGGTPRLYAATPESSIRGDLTSDQLPLNTRHYLYLSGTPFRALTEGEFNEDAIFNWTYPDEQRAKARWGEDPARAVAANPYAELPEMQMYTYALSQVASTAIDQGRDGLFDLSGFFEAKKVGSEYQFTDPKRVAEFLNMLRGRLPQSAVDKLLSDSTPPFPFSDARFGEATEHTVWLLPTVASAHAMKAALETHPYFRDFLVHVAAGAGAKMGAEAKGPVDAMLAKAAKHGKQTITLSVAKLMTGVTVPQWGAILVLRSLKSPESYFQAAFRVQSPWVARNDDGSRTIKKETCFVFDFDPNRALSLIYQYGTKLAADLTRTSPSQTLGELIEFLPIFAFDGGRMDPLDVNAVMDFGTAGAGAAMLAKRWASPRLIELSDSVLEQLLGNDELIGRLEQMEDFRNLRQDVTKVLAQSKKLRKAKRKTDGDPSGTEDPEVLAARKAKREQVKTLRAKLLKFLQAVPVFMYLTDFREEALVDVIESLDTQLFERVTGITLEDFHQLSALGVFSPHHMNEAIWQFRLFERASLDYLGTVPEDQRAGRVGLWDHSVAAVAADVA